MEVMRQLEGAYALIFKSSLYPNELVACKRGSPLILGIKEQSLDGAPPSAISADDHASPTADGGPAAKRRRVCAPGMQHSNINLFRGGPPSGIRVCYPII